jgi:hypothetical protein
LCRALLRERTRHGLIATAQCRFNQSAMNDVALRMAAAEGVGLVTDRQQQVHSVGKPALPEGIDGLHNRQTHFAVHAGVGALARSRRLHGHTSQLRHHVLECTSHP